MLFRILACLSAVLFITSCSEDPVVPGTSGLNKFTVNGSGYSEAVFTGYATDTASTAKQVGSAATIAFTGATTKSGEVFSIILASKSAAVGSNQINSGEGTTMTLYVSKSGTTTTYIATTGSITIDQWPAPGSLARGRFDGSFALSTDLGNNVIQVTAGSFEVIRQ